jgi:16S rRNA (guanine527-N7)-methyltransferase
MFHVKHHPILAPPKLVASSDPMPRPHLSEKSTNLLTQFAEHLLKWQDSQNLISGAERSRIWERHICDSLQLLSLAPDARIWLDVGSGNGFPSIVIASALVDVPGSLVHCVESDTRKCAFLASMARKLLLPIAIHPKRIEQIIPASIMPIDAVTARAFGSPRRLLAIANPYISVGAVGIFPIGKKLSAHPSEIPSNCNATYFASSTDGNSKILLVQRNKSADQCL